MSVVGGVDMNLPRLFVAVAILAPGIAISQVSPRGVRAHERETAEVRRLGVGPGVRPDARRTGMLAQRPSSPHGGEGNPVAPPRARSPLDQLDPKQIPAAEQFAWQPKGLVAVLGEHGVRHWSYVTQTAFAASGKFVVSEGWGGGLRLWDAATMQLKLWRHPARAFAISPNGKQLAVAEEREVIRVYDLDGATLRERLVLRKKNHAVFWESSPSITFAPDGQGLAVKYVDLEDFDRPIKQRKGKDVYVLWRWEKGKVREEELPRRRGSGRGVFALDGKIFLHAGSGSRLYLWNVGLKTPELRAVLERIDSFAVSPDGKLLVARRVDGAALWDMSAVPPKELTTMDTGNAAVKAFSPDGQLLACLNEDQLLLVSMGDVKRQIERKRALAVPREVKLPFRARVLSFSPDGHRLAFGGWDGSVRLWDVVNGRAVFPVRGPCGAVAAVQFSADGRTLATAGEDGNLRLWGLGGGRPRETFVTQFEPDSAPKALAVTAGGELLANRCCPCPRAGRTTKLAAWSSIRTRAGSSCSGPGKPTPNTSCRRPHWRPGRSTWPAEEPIKRDSI